MPRDSIGRRVARAASIGGSRSYRSATPWGWYAAVAFVCLAGIGLIALSRHQMLSRQTASSTTTTTQAPGAPPTATDHWQVALSVDICGKVANLPPSKVQASGLTTTGNGVVNVQPAKAGSNQAQFLGNLSTIGKFLSSEGVTLTSTSLQIPKSVGAIGGTYANGAKCGSKAGQVQLSIWSSPTSTQPFTISTSPQSVTYTNGAMYLVSFVPKGTKVPVPLGKALVAAYLQATTAPSTTTTIPATTTTTTPSKNGSTTTTAPSSTTTSTTGASGGTPTTTIPPSATTSTTAPG